MIAFTSSGGDGLTDATSKAGAAAGVWHNAELAANARIAAIVPRGLLMIRS
jgi:hypothetical protein